jgi:hypothetical protein
MSLIRVSSWREISARPRVADIVLDWLSDASFAVPIPTSAFSGAFLTASFTNCGTPLPLTLRPDDFPATDGPPTEDEAPPPEDAADGAEAHPAATAATTIAATSEAAIFPIFVFIENSFAVFPAVLIYFCTINGVKNTWVRFCRAVYGKPF